MNLSLLSIALQPEGEDTTVHGVKEGSKCNIKSFSNTEE